LCNDEINKKKKKGIAGSKKDLKTAMGGGWEALGTEPTVLNLVGARLGYGRRRGGIGR
jgi:hypothetical protein